MGLVFFFFKREATGKISPDEIVDYNEIPQFSTEDLDKEYFEWQESKERTGEKVARGKVKGQKLLARWKK